MIPTDPHRPTGLPGWTSSPTGPPPPPPPPGPAWGAAPPWAAPPTGWSDSPQGAPDAGDEATSPEVAPRSGAGSKLPPPPAGWTDGTAPAPAAGDPGPGISVQNLLLGLGTALVGVAAAVFTAVNWDRMGATVQGLFLVLATVIALAGAAACARRRMPATAEALGLVALVLALADAHAFRVGLFPRVEGDAWWAGALAVVSLGAWAFGVATEVRSTRIAAAVLGQLPLLLALAVIEPTATVAGMAILAQVAVVAVLASRGTQLLAEARAAAAVLAGICTWVVCGQAAVAAAFDDGLARRGPSSVLLVAAAVAALVAWLQGADERVRPAAAGIATVLGLGGACGLLATVVPATSLLPATGLVAVVVVAVGLRVDARWGRAPASVAGLVALGASAPLVAVVSSALVAASEVLNRAWAVDASTRASSLALDDAVGLPGVAVALHLALAALGLVAVAPAVRRSSLVGGGVVLAVVTCVSLPLVVPLSVAGAAVAALVAAAALVAVGLVLADRPGVLAGTSIVALGPLGLAGLWSAATPTLTLSAIATSAVLALAVSLSARDRGQRDLAAVAAGSIVLASASGAGLLLLANGASVGACWVAVAVAAAVVGLAGVLLLDADGAAERGDRPVDIAISHALEAVAWAIHGPALVVVLGLADRRALSLVLAVGVVAGGLHAVRPRRSALAWVAAGHAVPLVWLQLAEAGVQAPEPYVLPLALVLLGAGRWSERRAVAQGRTLGSWQVLGPALVVAFAPSVVVALSDPGLLRPLLVLAAGSVVLAAGALHGRRAPVDVGVVVVVLLGLRQLGPAVGGLPTWATIGSAGALLLAVGATFEQRRRDLSEVRHRYSSLV